MAGKRARPWGCSGIPRGVTVGLFVTGLSGSTTALTSQHCHLDLGWSMGGGSLRLGQSRRGLPQLRGGRSSKEGESRHPLRTTVKSGAVAVYAVRKTEIDNRTSTGTNVSVSEDSTDAIPFRHLGIEESIPFMDGEVGDSRGWKSRDWRWSRVIRDRDGEGRAVSSPNSPQFRNRKGKESGSLRKCEQRGRKIDSTEVHENNMLMFLLERGLSQRDMRRVLSVMKRDPKLAANVTELAARMQAISGLLEGVAAGCIQGAEETRSDLREDTVNGEMSAVARDREWGAIGGNGNSSEIVNNGWETGRWDHGTPAGGGAMLYTYQVVAKEPQLLLFDVESTLRRRLTGLLEVLPGLRDSRRLLWGAAGLLVLHEKVLVRRVEALRRLVPSDSNVQKLICQVPLLARLETRKVTEAVAVLERVAPGVRLDRVVLVAPQILMQPSETLERRIRRLKAALGFMNGKEDEEVVDDPVASFEHPRAGGGWKARGGQVGGSSTKVWNLDGGGGSSSTSGKKKMLTSALNAYPHMLVMDLQLMRTKIDCLGNLLPGLDGALLVRARPELLAFDARRTMALKVESLKALLPGCNLAALISRSPSLLSMSAQTVKEKLQKLQAMLPPGLEARIIVSKAPHVLNMDMDNTIPGKVGCLAAAFREHAGACGAEEAEMLAQVLLYYPSALRFSTQNLTGKVMTMCSLFPASTVRTIIVRVPKCLSVSEGTMCTRVKALQEMFPSLEPHRLVEGAPGIVVKGVDLVRQEEVIQKLFPSIDPTCVVEGAPMVLALSRETLATKVDAWKNVLGPVLAEPWEEAISIAPHVLCQGLGRGARVSYLFAQQLSRMAEEGLAPPVHVSDKDGEEERCNNNRMQAKEAAQIICQDCEGFLRDNPDYAAFLQDRVAWLRAKYGGEDIDLRSKRKIRAIVDRASAANLESSVTVGGEDRADTEVGFKSRAQYVQQELDAFPQRAGKVRDNCNKCSGGLSGGQHWGEKGGDGSDTEGKGGEERRGSGHGQWGEGRRGVTGAEERTLGGIVMAITREFGGEEAATCLWHWQRARKGMYCKDGGAGRTHR